MSTHNLYFEQKYENFQFLEMKFSTYLNRHVFVMKLRKWKGLTGLVWLIPFLSRLL